MECPLSYQEILDAYTVNRWDTGQHFCIRVTVPDGSVLLKVNTVYTYHFYSLWELTILVLLFCILICRLSCQTKTGTGFPTKVYKKCTQGCVMMVRSCLIEAQSVLA